MSDDEIADIFTEIRIYRETFPCKLTVIQADADIQKIIEYEELDGEEIPARIQIVGRGGTNFIPVFDWITTHAPSANLIYATDGFGTFPSFTISFSVIWLLTANAIDPASLPFGTCIKLTTRR
jgi:predicted metal-dependent peptidase